MERVRRVRDSRPCKVVLLGDAGSGKTCLLDRFLRNSFDVNTKPTIGAAFGTKILNTDNGMVSLQIWDTAGQERYLALASLYYRNANAAIICCDQTEAKSFHRMEYWVREVKNAERNCKIYVCGTKIDLIWDGLRSRSVTAEKLGIFNAPVIETSSKANYNVFQLFQRIADDMEPLNTGEGVDAVQFVSLSDRKPSVAEESKRSCCQSS